MTNSNITVGELVDALSAAKTAVSQGYAAGETVTYVISITNDDDAAVTGLTVTDDLGGFSFDGATVYPLEYVPGSLRYFADGVLQPEPAVTAGPPLVIDGIDVPAGGSALLVYEADVTRYAPLGAGAEITNTAVITGGCSPVTVSATIPMAGEPELTISKSVSPEVVTGCSEVTYTFVIQNAGSAAAEAADDVVLTDTFDPVLSSLTAALDGAALTAGTDYTYDEASGLFATAAGRITVPGAEFSQNADGTWTAAPGVAVLTVTGTM